MSKKINRSVGLSRRAYFSHLFVWLTLISLLLGACSPVTPPVPSAAPLQDTPIPSSEATPVPQATSTTAPPSDPIISPSATAPGLTIQDDGAPLPPQVIERQPQGELAPGQPVTLVFDQPMDTLKTGQAWQITGPLGYQLAGKLSWPNDRTMVFTPEDALGSGALYQASLSADAASKAGVPLSEPLSFNFQSVGELQVSQVFPADGAQAVESNAVITVIFNRPVVPLMTAEDMAALPETVRQPLEISPALEGTGEWVNTSVYAFRPSGFLASGVTYQVTVKTGLQDALGQSSLWGDYTWQFSTDQPRLDYFTLSEHRYNPDNGYARVLLDDYFFLRFLQPMEHSSTQAAVRLSGGPAADFRFVWSDDDMGLWVTPTQRLAIGTSYTLHVDPSAQAADGGTLQDGLEWRFSTVPLPRVQEVQPADGKTQADYSARLYIKFASPMRLDTLKERIVISPTPREDVEWYYDEWDFSYTAWLLEPSTKYEVRLLPGMEDIYGNAITQEQVLRFTTAPMEPYVRLAMPWGEPIMRADGPQEAQQFYLAHSNVKTITTTLSMLTVGKWFDLRNQSSLSEYRPPEKDVVWQKVENSDAAENQRRLQLMQPDIKGGPLLPGFYFLSLVSPEVKRNEQVYNDFRVIIVANATLMLKSSNQQLLAWLTDLETGEPVPGATVGFLTNTGNSIGSAVTDANGLASLDVTNTYEITSINALVDQDDRFAYVSGEWGSGVNVYDYGIWSNYYRPAFHPVAYLYTERPIYRPGQPVYFKGIVRIDNDLNYRLPSQSEVQVQIHSFEDTIYDVKLPLNANGTFSGTMTLAPEAALGSYDLKAILDGESIASLSFNVAEYRKPEYQVAVTTRPSDLLPGQDFSAQVQADYYAGGGVAGAALNWTLTAKPYFFQPPDEFSAYNFTNYDDDLYFYAREGGNGSRFVAEGSGQTDGSGQFSLSLPASLGENNAARTLLFEASLTDMAQTTVSGRSSVVVHPSAVYPGIRSSAYIAEQGKETSFDLLALDWDGQALAGQALQVEIVERRWHSIQEQSPSGRIEWKSEVEEISVAKFDDIVTDAQGKAGVSFTPPNGGGFSARVTALDGQGNRARASATVWVAGKDYIPWRQSNDRGFNLITDKRSYNPGETAQVLIASPFQGPAYALVTVERGLIRFSEVLPLDGNSTVYKLRITRDLAPNAYISVLVVKGVDEFNPRPNFKMGMTQIEVSTAPVELKVELTPDHSEAAPGDLVSYTVRTTDSGGQPVSAEVSLSLSDLATLSLLPPNSMPILDFFYNNRNLGVWTAMGLVQNIDDYNQEIAEEVQDGQAAGSGGGGQKGDGDFGVVGVRQNFPDTAYWQADLQTDSQGQAVVTIRLPDNLTTWRLDARAVADGTRVGQATVDIISTRPLLLRPQTPRFFIANDEARLGAAVHNNTAAAFEVTVSLNAHGLEITAPISQTVTIPGGGQSYITWPVRVLPDADRVDVLFRAVGGGYEDASLAPQGTLDEQGLPVYRYEAPETVGTAGVLSGEGTRIEGLYLPQNLPADSGEVTVRMQPSLAGGIVTGLDALKSNRYDSIEQTVSRFLPNALALRAFDLLGRGDPVLADDLEAQVQTALQRLAAEQKADGGWGWWGSDESHPLVTAYAVLGLMEAGDSSPVWQRAVNYLRTQVVPLESLNERWLVNRQAFIGYVLARAGQPDASAAGQLFEQRRRMQLYAQAYLVETLALIDPGDPRIQTLLSDFNSAAILSATGAHWEEAGEPDRWNWNTDTRTTAIVLAALSRLDVENPLNANAVRWLMAHRTNGQWRNSQETAWTLMALVRWMEASGETQANYTYALGLNGETLASGQADSSTLLDTQTVTIDIRDLLADELNRLAFAHSGGPGNLYYTTHLRVNLPADQIEPLARGVTVARAYYALDDLQAPITQTALGEMVLVRLTVVAPAALHYLVVDDPLPAGLEAVDQSLNTSAQAVEVPQQLNWSDITRRGFGWWAFSHIQYRDERVLLSADYLPAGTYVYTYLARAATVGRFQTIPTTAQEVYFPEVYGRSAGMLFTIVP